MKQIKNLIILLAFISLCACSNERVIIDDKLNFKITFPNSPTKSKIENPTTLFQGIEYKYKTSIENTIYSIISYNIPVSFFQNDTNRFDKILYYMLIDEEYTENNIIRNEIVNYAHFKGYSIKWKLKNLLIAQKRIFLINDVLYIISVITPEQKSHNNSIFDFFTSFEIDGIINTQNNSTNVFKKSYKIKFDRPTKFETTEISTSNYGNLTINLEISENDINKSNFMYGIVSSVLPVSSDSLNIEELESVFNDFIKGAVGSLPANLLSVEDIKYKGFPGKDIKMQWYANGQEVIIRTRYYFIKKNLYGLSVYYLPKKENIKDIEDFYNSFIPIIE